MRKNTLSVFNAIFAAVKTDNTHLRKQETKPFNTTNKT